MNELRLLILEEEKEEGVSAQFSFSPGKPLDVLAISTQKPTDRQTVLKTGAENDPNSRVHTHSCGGANVGWWRQALESTGRQKADKRSQHGLESE